MFEMIFVRKQNSWGVQPSLNPPHLLRHNAHPHPSPVNGQTSPVLKP